MRCCCDVVDALDNRNTMQQRYLDNQEAVSAGQHDSHKQIFTMLAHDIWRKNAVKSFPR